MGYTNICVPFYIFNWAIFFRVLVSCYSEFQRVYFEINQGFWICQLEGPSLSEIGVDDHKQAEAYVLQVSKKKAGGSLKEENDEEAKGAILFSRAQQRCWCRLIFYWVTLCEVCWTLTF